MKKYLPLLGLAFIFLAPQAFAAISFVNSSVSANNAAGTNQTTTINITSGNLIVLSCRHGTTFVSPTNATDTIGNTFNNFAIASNSNQGAITGYWAISTGSNASDVVGCNFASSVGGRAMVATQFSGIATTTPLDANVVNATNTSLTSYSAGPFTTAQPTEVIVGMAAIGGGATTLTAGAGYTLATSTTFGASSAIGTEYQIVNSIQTNVSTTISSVSTGPNWMFAVGSFYGPSSTAPDALFFAGD